MLMYCSDDADAASGDGDPHDRGDGCGYICFVSWNSKTATDGQDGRMCMSTAVMI